MRQILLWMSLGAVFLTACGGDEPGPRSAAKLWQGRWDAWLDSPGGVLRFGLELKEKDGSWAASLINGTERIAVPGVQVEDGEVVLDIEHYAAEIRATFSDGGQALAGHWVKRRPEGAVATLPFHARSAGAKNTFTPQEHFAGRWRVTFSSDDQNAAIGEFRSTEAGLEGTFLTLTGDYRYLAGVETEDSLELSCFDGAHAFLFRAELKPDGSLAGDFWSANSWHETWTAVRDDDIQLADGFSQTRWLDGVDVDGLTFPDLEGVSRSLGDSAFAGRARILQIFGSWCPNCHDAAEFLVELEREYGAKGLSIIGLAFEMTGDQEKDAEQARRYAERHGAGWPILLAGTAKKDDATRQLGALDRVRSFPTTVFVAEDGRVHAVYSGFSGPATGSAYARLQSSFRRILDELLTD